MHMNKKEKNAIEKMENSACKRKKDENKMHDSDLVGVVSLLVWIGFAFFYI